MNRGKAYIERVAAEDGVVSLTLRLPDGTTVPLIVDVQFESDLAAHELASKIRRDL